MAVEAIDQRLVGLPLALGGRVTHQDLQSISV